MRNLHSITDGDGSLAALLRAPQSAMACRFFAPLFEVLPRVQAQRRCPDLPDADWLSFGTLRALHDLPSGRGFLQEVAAGLPNCPEVGQFFETLKSKRRLELCHQASRWLASELERKVPDGFSTIGALRDFEVYAGDGHFHAAAAHDPRDIVTGDKHATGHLFALDLRRHLLHHLTVADQLQRRKEHDMRALKRLESDRLRLGAARGRKVLWVWDRAGIDFRQWHDWKQAAGIYFLSREKENMALEVMGENRWDHSDPINAGTVADELCGPSTGRVIRRVRWRDPVEGKEYAFVTNEMTLPPGVLAELYRRRWDIEKVFDQLKNKLGATKAWASSPNAKTMQALFMCLAHNLLLHLETVLATQYDLRPDSEMLRREKRLKQQEAKAEAHGRPFPSLWQSTQRLTQRTVKFIRWLRSNILRQALWPDLIATLRLSYAST